MTLASQMISDLTTVFFNTDEFAVAGTYTPPSGAAVSIEVLPDYGVGSPMEGMDTLHTSAIFDIMKSDVALVVVGGVIVIGSDTWDVVYAELVDDGLIWRCNVSRRTR